MINAFKLGLAGSLFAIVLGVLLSLAWASPTTVSCNTGFTFYKGQCIPHFAPTANPADWIIEKVCVDPKGNEVLADPYHCPKGDSLRPLQAGELLPYQSHDQPGDGHPNGYQLHNAYPIFDRQGNPLIITSRTRPDAPARSIPHFNVNVIKEGWVSGSETRDDTGFSQTFFGGDCKPYNGWVLYPTNAMSTAAFPSSGSIQMPISGLSWEQNGVPAPGVCPKRLNTEVLTTWNFVPHFAFSGTNGEPVKYLDTIVSTHGYETAKKFLSKGHLEVLYFTQLYGETRWEAWRPVQQGVKTIASGRCLGPTEMTYQGQQFNLTDCRDWSAVTVASTPRQAPILPIPDVNLLDNWHFDHDTIAPWHRMGNSVDTNKVINWSKQQSLAPKDIQRARLPGKGVRYLAINCNGQCSGKQFIYQDIPITVFRNNANYAYGATVRSENGAGELHVQLMQIDRSGNVLPGTTDTLIAKVDAGDASVMSQSVPLSSQFVTASTVVKIHPNAVAMRFALSPQTPNVFDITDSWLMNRSYN